MYKPLAIFFCLVFCLLAQSSFGQRLGDPTGKLGIMYKSYIDSVVNFITLDSTADLSNEALQSANIGGALGFYEHLFTDSFGVAGYFGQVVRQTKIRIDSIDSVLKDSSIVYGVYAKTYSTRARRNGLKYFAGAHYEIMNVNLEFQNTTSKLDEETISTQVSIVGGSIGMEYKLKFAAFRGEIGLNAGESRIKTSTHIMLFDFNTLFVSLGIMSMF